MLYLLREFAESAIIGAVRLCALVLVGFSGIALFAMMSGAGNSGGGWAQVLTEFAKYVLMVAAYFLVHRWIRGGLVNLVQWVVAIALLLPPLYLLGGWRLFLT